MRARTIRAHVTLEEAIARIDEAVGSPHPGGLPLDVFLFVSRLVLTEGRRQRCYTGLRVVRAAD